jgi:hypothetical protein
MADNLEQHAKRLERIADLMDRDEAKPLLDELRKLLARSLRLQSLVGNGSLGRGECRGYKM